MLTEGRRGGLASWDWGDGGGAIRRGALVIFYKHGLNLSSWGSVSHRISLGVAAGRSPVCVQCRPFSPGKAGGPGLSLELEEVKAFPSRVDFRESWALQAFSWLPVMTLREY